MASLEILTTKLGHEYQQQELLEQALTHRSFGTPHNERLEFLGDSILNFVIGHALYQYSPQAKEGKLSRLRANLVNGEMLAVLAREFDLGAYLRLGVGELKSGGAERKSILADTLEAIIASIYLDAGMDKCEQCVLSWYGDRIEQAFEDSNIKDAKTELQEYVQAQKMSLPNYEILIIGGQAHAQRFHVRCTVAELDIQAEGSGSSRRRAEQAAAKQMLNQLKQD